MLNNEPKKIEALFDKISSYYDFMNNFISFFTHNLIKQSAIKMLGIKHKSMVLDLCCGTGDLTSLISKSYSGTKVIGLDISLNMLKIAKKKHPKNVFIKGDAESIAFGENEFDAVTCAFGLRNVQNRKKALNEIYRILKPGGLFLHLDFKRSIFYEKLFEIAVRFWVWVFRIDSNSYNYLLNSIKEFPSVENLVAEYCESGLKFIKRKDYLGVSVQIFQK